MTNIIKLAIYVFVAVFVGVIAYFAAIMFSERYILGAGENSSRELPGTGGKPETI